MTTDPNDLTPGDGRHRPTEAEPERPTPATGAPGANEDARPAARQPVRMVLALPDWFRTIRAQRRLTQEELDRLAGWLGQQIAGSPLDPENFRSKPEDQKPG